MHFLLINDRVTGSLMYLNLLVNSYEVLSLISYLAKYFNLLSFKYCIHSSVYAEDKVMKYVLRLLVFQTDKGECDNQNVMVVTKLLLNKD